MPSRRSRRSVLRGIGATLSIGALAGCTQDQACRVPDAGGGRGSRNPGGRSATGGASDRFYQNGPPTRDGNVAFYDGSNYASLQAAYDSLASGDTLVIEPGTYTERLSLDSNPADHVTIEGAGRDEVTIVQPDDAERYTVGMVNTSPEYTTQTALRGSHVHNEAVLQLESVPQDWSAGDIIRIREDQPPYHAPDHGYVGDEPTHELGTIARIDRPNREVELANPLWHPYPNEYETAVGLVTDFVASDIRLSNLTIHGDPSLYSDNSENLMPLYLSGLHNLWADNLTVEHAANDGMLCRLSYSYRCRFDNMLFNDGDRYGLDIVQGTCDTYATNLEAQNINRYVMRMGDPSSDEAGAPVGGLGQGITATDYDNFACNSHLPSWHVYYDEVAATNCPLARLRSYGQTVDNFTVNATNMSGGSRVIAIEQTAHDCLVRGGAPDGTPDVRINDGHVFYFNTHNPSVRSYDEYAQNITFENISIAKIPGKSAADIGLFTPQADIRGDIIFKVWYDGELVTRQDIQNWENYETTTTDQYNIIVEGPNSQS